VQIVSPIHDTDKLPFHEQNRIPANLQVREIITVSHLLAQRGIHSKEGKPSTLQDSVREKRKSVSR